MNYNGNNQQNNNPPPLLVAEKPNEVPSGPYGKRSPMPTSRGIGDTLGSYDPAFADEFKAVDGRMSFVSIIDDLLKSPAHLLYEINEKRYLRISAAIAVLVLACMVLYGFIVGSFPGGEQLLVVPLKLIYGLALTAVVCFPSLYIFLGLSGSKQSLPQIAAVFLLGLGLCSLLLLGFAPISWVFTLSTDAPGFIATLHVVCWLIALHYGVNLMRKALDFLNDAEMKALTVWKIIFLIVSLQMLTSMRPLIGEYEDTWLSGKRSFVEQYFRMLK